MSIQKRPHYCKCDKWSITRLCSCKCEAVERFKISKGSAFTHTSYGRNVGSFEMDTCTVSTIIIQNNFLSNYAIAEKLSPYFKLIWDIDLGKQDVQSYNIDGSYIIDKINLAIAYYGEIDIGDSELEYIYCDKSDETYGIHLYYPNIILDKIDARVIRWRAIEFIKNDNKFELPDEVIESVLDNSIYDGQIRLIHQWKNGSYYKINKDKSTYKNIPGDIKSQIELTSVRTNEKDYKGWYYRYDAHDYPLIYKDRDTLLNKVEDEEKREIVEKQFKDIGERLDEVTEIANNISLDYLDKYNLWIKIVFVLRREKLYDLAHEISRKSTKYNKKDLDKELRRHDKQHANPVTLGTIYEFSKKSNLQKHKKIIAKYKKCKVLTFKHTDEILLKDSEQFYKHYLEENCNVISDNAIKQMMKYNTIIIHGSTGIGKTKTSVKLVDKIEKENPGKRILSIVSRQTMAQLHETDFKNLDLICYLKNPDKGNDRYIISMEQLWTLKDAFHIVLLDEITSLIFHVYSPTMDNYRIQSFSKMNRFIKSAELVIVCDAMITTMTLYYISALRDKDTMLYYRNRYQNKLGKTLTIYDRKHNTVNMEIQLFILQFKDKIINSEELLIFLDSKTTADSIYKFFLNNWNDNKDYYVLITSLSFDINMDCNKDWVGKCVIISPKIVYGLHCLILYTQIFGIYHGNSIGSFGMVQQSGRARRVGEVNVLFTGLNYCSKENKYISWEKVIEDENFEIREYLEKFGNKESEKIKILKELGCIEYQDGEITLDSSKIFSKIHLYRTYYDRLFANNKSQLFVEFSKEQGYDIEFKSMNKDISKAVYDRSNDEMVKEFADMLERSILGEDMKDDYKYLNPKHVKGQIESIKERRMEILNVDIEDAYKDTNLVRIISDSKVFDAVMRSLPLFMTEEYLNEKKLDKYYHNFPEIEKNNKVHDRLTLIRWLENKLGIKRFKINDIVLDDNGVMDFKKTLLKEHHLLMCLPLPNGQTLAKKKILKRIENLKDKDQVQKFVAECYNSFDDFIEYKSKKSQIKNVQKWRFSDFKLKEGVLKDHICFLYYLGISYDKILICFRKMLKDYKYEIKMFDD